MVRERIGNTLLVSTSTRSVFQARGRCRALRRIEACVLARRPTICQFEIGGFLRNLPSGCCSNSTENWVINLRFVQSFHSGLFCRVLKPAWTKANVEQTNDMGAAGLVQVYCIRAGLPLTEKQKRGDSSSTPP